MSQAVFFCVLFGFICASATTVTEAPVSQNVSAGHMVEFTCATANNDDIVTWSTIPDVGSITPSSKNLPGGGIRSMLTFTALLEHSNTIVRCLVTDPNTATSTINSALLLVQGSLSAVSNLISGEVDHCVLNVTWTAPYTLPGVPINYYTINITRHSDGAVLRSDTTNTTEYLYSVSSLGETLEVVLAAVNGAGTGNATSIMRQTPSSIINSTLTKVFKEVVRNVSIWTYTFHFVDMLCGNAISHVIVEACLNSSFCIITNETVNMLPDGIRSVVAAFTDLIENRKYTSTSTLSYNGGLTQQSKPVEISTFDVLNVTLNGPVVRGRVCLHVTYVEGHEANPRCFVVFRSTITGHDVYHETIQGSSMCIPNVPAHPSYTIIATDGDAVDEINTTAPVTILGVVVPEYMQGAISPTSFNNVTTSPSSINLLDLPIIISTVTTIVVLLVAAIIFFILSLICLKRCNSNKEFKERAEDKMVADVGSSSEGAPHPAPSGEPKELMSIAQEKCLEVLAKMDTLPLDYITLYNLLQPLALQWYQFGKSLAPSHFDYIEKNNLSSEERLQAVLISWEEKQWKPFTWETLLTALHEVGATRLADELRKKSDTLTTEL